MPALAPTPRDVLLTDGTAKLLRFRSGSAHGVPLLLVPSMINRWYVLDLREGVSLAASLLTRGLDVWCLDWGAPHDEDRYLTLDDVMARLARAVRRVKRETGAESVALLGYCMGGTLAATHAALDPRGVAALVNLAGPVDFSKAGFLAHSTRPRWFDAASISQAGNLSSAQMQSAFQMLRPTLALSKWVTFFERGADPAFRTAFEALETWANDNVDFPAAAWETWIRELYQENRLARGELAIAGRRADLRRVRCPVLTVVADRDTICPPDSARALLDCCSATDKELLTVPGGHVGAVVGSKAATTLYPAIGDWLAARLLENRRRVQGRQPLAAKPTGPRA